MSFFRIWVGSLQHATVPYSRPDDTAIDVCLQQRKAICEQTSKIAQKTRRNSDLRIQQSCIVYLVLVDIGHLLMDSTRSRYGSAAQTACKVEELKQHGRNWRREWRVVRHSP